MISKFPSELLKSKDPFGNNNNLITLEALEFWIKNINCDLWLEWWDKGKLYSRDRRVLKLIRNLSKLDSSNNIHSRRVLCLGLSKKGSPRHLLYMPNESFLNHLKSKL